MLKHLSEFFDAEKFFKDKVLLSVGCTDWVDYNTKAKLGTKVETVIYKDNTAYQQKDGQLTTNQFEKLTLKIKKNMQIAPNVRVVPVNPVCRVYGQYANCLSVTCDDLQVIQPKP